jgi:hypothetical protein
MKKPSKDQKLRSPVRAAQAVECHPQPPRGKQPVGPRHAQPERGSELPTASPSLARIAPLIISGQALTCCAASTSTLSPARSSHRPVAGRRHLPRDGLDEPPPDRDEPVSRSPEPREAAVPRYVDADLGTEGSPAPR